MQTTAYFFSGWNFFLWEWCEYLSVGTTFRNRLSNTWIPYHSLSLYHTKRRKMRWRKGEDDPAEGKYWEWLLSPPSLSRKRKSHDNRCLRLGNMQGTPRSYWKKSIFWLVASESLWWKGALGSGRFIFRSLVRKEIGRGTNVSLNLREYFWHNRP